ncbi:hypothetical protein B0E45_17825 [Sinorhizobium sp. A49]|uniref:hypothetical protein n=1 Tax=Sinorhizobium sp. A49 TaxID=1945861 RepID=UPI00098482FB|nr:hypothetical protein [Sinorhizobium sp. A49]OOG68187.1 hypothetical protein B0E45_17825 [Sinorhizobium sp. A49]
MPRTETSTAFFLIDHGCSGHVFTELGSIIEAPDLLAAKRMAVDLSPDWTTDLHVTRISAVDVNELRLIIEEAKSEANAHLSERQ